MVKLRMLPTGKTVQRSFRIVATDARKKLNGKYLDKVGTYNPNTKEVKIDEAKVLIFLQNGAQPTETVRTLLSKQGILTKFSNLKLAEKKAVTSKKTKTSAAKTANSKAKATA